MYENFFAQIHKQSGADKLHDRILIPDGLRVVCAGSNIDPALFFGGKKGSFEPSVKPGMDLTNYSRIIDLCHKHTYNSI